MWPKPPFLRRYDPDQVLRDSLPNACLREVSSISAPIGEPGGAPLGCFYSSGIKCAIKR